MPDLPPIDEDQATLRLDRLLRQKFPTQSLSAIQRALRLRQVRVNNKRIKAPDYRLNLSDVVHVPQYFLENKAEKQKTPSPDNTLQQHLKAMLVAETPEYFVLNKPAGLAVQGGTGVRWHLDRMLPQLALLYGEPVDSLRIVHRLDKDTSGLLLIARGRKAAERLSRLFQQHRIEKFYIAICDGVPKVDAGTISIPLGKGGDHRMTDQAIKTQRAITDYRVFDQLAALSAVVMLSPKTGRTHQLRAHLSMIDAPIAGDPLYGVEATMREGTQSITYPPEIQAGGLCLHATILRVPTKDEAGTDEYFAPPPKSMHALAEARSIRLPNLKAFLDTWYS